jgi:hypothetical protein
MVEQALLHYPDFTQDLGFPIGHILDKLFKHHLKAVCKLEGAIDALEKDVGVPRKDDPSRMKVGCSAEGCHDLVIANLDRQRENAQLFSQKQGLSFSAICIKINREGPWFDNYDYFHHARKSKNSYSSQKKRTPCCSKYENDLCLWDAKDKAKNQLMEYNIRDLGFVGNAIEVGRREVPPFGYCDSD